ncbi:hypothetical protein N9B60_06640 [Mariniblastus sp.]|nr:hypothetical protein [Mariniblastus sp.]
MLLGWSFGVGDEISAWFTAMTIRNVFFSLIQSGRISSAFVPEHIRISEEHSKQASTEFASALMTWFLVLSIAACIVSSLAITPMINLFFFSLSNETIVLSKSLAAMLIWIIVFDSALAIMMAVLRAENCFKTPEIAQLTSSVVLITVVYFGHEYCGVWILLIAAYAQALVSLTITIQKCYFLSILPKIQFRSSFLRKDWLIKTLSAISFYTFSTQLVSLFLASALTKLPDAFYPSFNYMKSAINKVVGSIISPLMSVGITKTAKEKNNAQLGKFIKQNNRLVAFLIISLFTGYIFSANLAIRFLWNVKDPLILEVMWDCGFVLLVTSTTGLAFTSFRMRAYSLNHAGALYFFWSLWQLTAALFLYLFPSDGSLTEIAMILFTLNFAVGATSVAISKWPRTGLVN